jgi:hypothetical protein
MSGGVPVIMMSEFVSCADTRSRSSLSSSDAVLTCYTFFRYRARATDRTESTDG